MSDELAEVKSKYQTLLNSIYSACVGTGCVNAHELREKLDVLKAEVKAWRAWHKAEPEIYVEEVLLYQAAINAKKNTDAAKALEEK